MGSNCAFSLDSNALTMAMSAHTLNGEMACRRAMVCLVVTSSLSAADHRVARVSWSLPIVTPLLLLPLLLVAQSPHSPILAHSISFSATQ